MSLILLQQRIDKLTKRIEELETFPVHLLTILMTLAYESPDCAKIMVENMLSEIEKKHEK